MSERVATRRVDPRDASSPSPQCPRACSFVAAFPHLGCSLPAKRAPRSRTQETGDPRTRCYCDFCRAARPVAAARMLAGALDRLASAIVVLLCCCVVLLRRRVFSSSSSWRVDGLSCVGERVCVYVYLYIYLSSACFCFSFLLFSSFFLFSRLSSSGPLFCLLSSFFFLLL